MLVSGCTLPVVADAGDGVGDGAPVEGRDWVDLAANPPGIGVTHEAARRRHGFSACPTDGAAAAT